MLRFLLMQIQVQVTLTTDPDHEDTELNIALQ